MATSNATPIYTILTDVTFALLGANGQRICVDPASKLIMVQTAVEGTDEVWRLWSALVEQFGQG
jgi:hypothetical protein